MHAYSIPKLYMILFDPIYCSSLAPLLSWDFSGKNTGVDCHFLLQGNFPTQGSNPCLLHWQVDSGGVLSSVQFSSVTQPCPTLCNPMNCSTPGLPVHHQLLEFTQTYVHQVSDAIPLWTSPTQSVSTVGCWHTGKELEMSV